MAVCRGVSPQLRAAQGRQRQSQTVCGSAASCISPSLLLHLPLCLNTEPQPAPGTISTSSSSVERRGSTRRDRKAVSNGRGREQPPKPASLASPLPPDRTHSGPWALSIANMAQRGANSSKSPRPAMMPPEHGGNPKECWPWQGQQCLPLLSRQQAVPTPWSGPDPCPHPRHNRLW